MIATLATWMKEAIEADADLAALTQEFSLRSLRVALVPGRPERGQAFPCIEIAPQSPFAAGDTDRCGNPMWKRGLIRVKAILRGVGVVESQRFYDRFYALFTAKDVTLPGLQIRITWESDFYFDEVTGSDRYTHHGGVWALTVQEV